jgi:hypothetical protein
MSVESLRQSEPLGNYAQASAPEPLSQSGQIIGWFVYGALLVVGFAFGIVTGYEPAKTITVAKATPEKDQTKPETPKPDTKTTPKPTTGPDQAQPQPVSPMPKETPTTPPKETPTPKVEPKPPMPTTTPKVDPKPPMPVTTTPPKTETPKKEDIKAVSFKADVLPILRTHCLNCHGAVGKPKGNVDLRTIASLKNSPSENNKMLVSGKPDESDFITSITQRGMPKDRPQPSEKELLILKNWVLTGGKD